MIKRCVIRLNPASYSGDSCFDPEPGYLLVEVSPWHGHSNVCLDLRVGVDCFLHSPRSCSDYSLQNILYKMSHASECSQLVHFEASGQFYAVSGLDVRTFATRRLHTCHHARAPSGRRYNCGREMSGNFT